MLLESNICLYLLLGNGCRYLKDFPVDMRLLL